MHLEGQARGQRDGSGEQDIAEIVKRLSACSESFTQAFIQRWEQRLEFPELLEIVFSVGHRMERTT